MSALLAALTLLVHTPVVCASMHHPGALGEYDAVSHTVSLNPDVCARLALLQRGGRPLSLPTQRDLAEAIWIVGHEWAHAQGVHELYPAADVGADCAGLKHFRRVASRLGLAAGYTERLYGYAEAVLLRECP